MPGQPSSNRLSSRFILVERCEGGSAMDLAVYLPNSQPTTAADAAATIFGIALGEIDDAFVPVERDDPAALVDMYLPPPGFPLIRLDHRDGNDRPETIAAVIAHCTYVVALRAIPILKGSASG